MQHKRYGHDTWSSGSTPGSGSRPSSGGSYNTQPRFSGASSGSSGARLPPQPQSSSAAPIELIKYPKGEQGIYDQPQIQIFSIQTKSERWSNRVRNFIAYAIVNTGMLVILFFLIAPIFLPHDFNTIPRKGGWIAFHVFASLWAILAGLCNGIAPALMLIQRARRRDQPQRPGEKTRISKTTQSEDIERTSYSSRVRQQYSIHPTPQTRDRMQAWLEETAPLFAPHKVAKYSNRFAAVRNQANYNRRRYPNSDSISINRPNSIHEIIVEEPSSNVPGAFDDSSDVLGSRTRAIQFQEPLEYPFPRVNSPESYVTWLKKQDKGKSPASAYCSKSPPLNRRSCSYGSRFPLEMPEYSRCSSMDEITNRKLRVVNGSPPNSEVEINMEAMHSRLMAIKKSDDSDTTRSMSSRMYSLSNRGEHPSDNKSLSQSSGSYKLAEEECIRQMGAPLTHVLKHGTHQEQLAAFNILNAAYQMMMEAQLALRGPDELSVPQKITRQPQEMVEYGQGTRTGKSAERPKTSKKRTAQAKCEVVCKYFKSKEGGENLKYNWPWWIWFMPFIVIILLLLTVGPLIITLGGPYFLNDYWFDHACDHAGWDIRLDALSAHKVFPGMRPDPHKAYIHDKLNTDEHMIMHLEQITVIDKDSTLAYKKRNWIYTMSSSDLLPNGYYDPTNPRTQEFFPTNIEFDIDNKSYRQYMWNNDIPKLSISGKMDPRLLTFPDEKLWLAKLEGYGECREPKLVLKNEKDETVLWTVVKKSSDCTQMKVCAANCATRRQVLVSTGLLLWRFKDSAECCTQGKKKSGGSTGLPAGH